MLLFPVVSATDDLHTMRPEMEESTSSKRAAKPAAGKSSLNLMGGVPAPAHLAIAATLCFDDQVCGKILATLVPLPEEVHAPIGTGRSPPGSRLS